MFLCYVMALWPIRWGKREKWVVYVVRKQIKQYSYLMQKEKVEGEKVVILTKRKRDLTEEC